MALVEERQNVCEDCGILSTRGADSHSLTRLEEVVRDNGAVDLVLELLIEAGLADGMAVLRSLDGSALLFAGSAKANHGLRRKVEDESGRKKLQETRRQEG